MSSRSLVLIALLGVVLWAAGATVQFGWPTAAMSVGFGLIVGVVWDDGKDNRP